jgi:hypothetical protein
LPRIPSNELKRQTRKHTRLSIKNSLLILIELGLTIFFSWLFGLPLHFSAILLICGFVLTPFFIHYQIQWHTHEQAFFVLTDFLQQVIASFKQHPKIYASLLECVDVTQGKLKSDVEKWLKALQLGAKPKAHAEVFLAEQSHFIIGNLVHLMLAVEQFGTFNYGEGLEIIQDDIEDWIEDTYLYKHSINSTRNRIQILCLFSLVIAYVSHSMLFKTEMIEALDFYYVSLFMFLLLNLVTLFLSQRLISKPWIDQSELIWRK